MMSLAFTRLSLPPAPSVLLQLRGPGGRHPPEPAEVSRAALHQAQALRHVKVITPLVSCCKISGRHAARSLVVLLLDLMVGLLLEVWLSCCYISVRLAARSLVVLLLDLWSSCCFTVGFFLALRSVRKSQSKGSHLF